MEHAAGEAVVVMDADLQDPPEVVLELAAKWREGFDIVYASRLSREGESRLKLWTAALFYAAIRKLTAVDIPANVGDFRLVDRKAVDAFRSMPERDRFVRGMFSWMGFSQTCVAFHRESRKAGRSHYGWSKMVKLASDGIIGFSDVPLRLALWLGAFVSVAALGYGAWATTMALLGAQFVSGWASTIVLVSLLAGLNLLMTGLVGIYVGRIHTEVKGRPLFVIGRKVGFADAEGRASGQGLPEVHRLQDKLKAELAGMSMAMEAALDLGAASKRTARVPRFALPITLGLITVLFALSRGSALLGDPDTQWHIAVGRWIVAHGAVPTTDLFSYTAAGSPWIAKEWISQLILFFAYEAGGWKGEVLLTTTVVAATFVGMYAWLGIRMNAAAAFALTCGAFCLSQVHMLARPHLLVMPVMLGWLIVLVSSLDRGKAPPLVAALLIVAWTNMHGSFPFGLVMASVLAGEGVANATSGTRLAMLRSWALFLFVASAVTVLSPFGWRAILVPLLMFGNSGTMRYVNEWRPLGFDAVGMIAGYMLVITAAILLLDARRNLFRILAGGLVAYLMIQHIRFVSVFGLICPILVARTVSAYMPALPLDRPIRPATRHAIFATLATAALVAAVVAIVERPRPAGEVAPQAAFDAAMAHGVRGTVFNDYNFGGFLIAHDVKTFVDGRTDQLFLGDFLPDLMKAVDDKDDAPFAAIVARSKAGWALIRPKSKTSAHFDHMPGWARVYEDDDAAVYGRLDARL